MKNLIKTVLKIIIIAVLVVAVFKGYNALVPTISSNLSITARTSAEQHFTAHRGLSAVAPENTAPSIEEAGKKGYYAAEFDIRPTKDGVWVLMHDDTVDRMTDGEGLVSDFTYAEIMELTVDAGNGIKNYSDLKISTLEEALDICEKYSMRAMIEIKGGEPDDMADVLEIISSKNLSVEPLIIDFSSERIEKIRSLDEKIELWYLVSKVGDGEIEFAAENSTAIAFKFAHLPNLLKVNDARDAGVICAAWTVDYLPLADILTAFGVKYVTTNRILP